MKIMNSNSGRAIPRNPLLIPVPDIAIVTLSSGATADAFISAGNTGALGSRSRPSSPRGCTVIRCAAPAVPLPSFARSRGWHSLQHLFHAGESRGADRRRSGLPTERIFRHLFKLPQLSLFLTRKYRSRFKFWYWRSSVFQFLIFFSFLILLETRERKYCRVVFYISLQNHKTRRYIVRLMSGTDFLF